MIRTQGLTHLHLAVRDLRLSLQFYREVFGMKELFWSGGSMVFLQTEGTNDLITLRQADSAEATGPGGGIGHFGLRLADGVQLDAAVEEVIAAGGRLLGRGEHAPGVPYAYVSDPDGYVIEL